MDKDYVVAEIMAGSFNSPGSNLEAQGLHLHFAKEKPVFHFYTQLTTLRQHVNLSEVAELFFVVTRDITL